MKYIKDIYALYPDLSNHTMLPLKYLEFIFYEANKCQQQSKDCWDFLKTHAKSGDIASKLFSYAEDFAFYTAIENGNLNKAFQYFLPPVPNPNIAVLDWSVTDVILHHELSRKVDKEVIKARLLLEKLQQKILNLATEQASSVATAETNFTNDIIAIDLTEDTNELSEIIDTLDPKAIHAYFQQKKMELLKKPIEITVKAPPPCVWNTQTGIYSSDQKDVYPVEGTKNFYATINPKLFDSLVPELRDQFTKALPYLIGRDHKSNGIKTIHKRLIELKIPKKDYRLYTKHIYKNDQGEYLIEFDHGGRHPDVQEQMTGKSSWKVITCKDKVSCTPNIPKEVKETETSYSVQHITKEMKHVSVSEEEWGVKLSGNDDVTQKDSHL